MAWFQRHGKLGDIRHHHSFLRKQQKQNNSSKAKMQRPDEKIKYYQVCNLFLRGNMSFSIVKHRCPKRLDAMSFLIEQGYKNPKDKKSYRYKIFQKNCYSSVVRQLCSNIQIELYRTIQHFNQLKVMVAEFNSYFYSQK